MNKKLLRDRIDLLMREHNITCTKDIVDYGHPLYQKVYRQLFNNKEADITYDVLYILLDKYKDVSTNWLILGEGPMESTKIVTPPTHRQDIHIAQGATAAITQTGSASLPDTPARAEEEHTPAPSPAHASTPADIARMIKDSDLTGLIAVILEQQSTISSIKDSTIALQSTIISLQQTIADLQHELVHTQSAYINNPSHLCPISKLSNKKGSQSPD